jgi:alpha-tubulin suppressor-like RCC1 family protein
MDYRAKGEAERLGTSLLKAVPPRADFLQLRLISRWVVASVFRSEGVRLVMSAQEKFVRRMILFGAASTILVCLAACGGSDSGTGPSTEITSVTLSPNTLSLLRGESRQLAALDQAGRELAASRVTWTASPSGIATVSPAGVLTAVGEGAATITATAEGKNGTATVTVSTVTFASVAAGEAHTCALTTSGAAYCWGRGEYGQLGATPSGSCSIDGVTYACSLVPIAVQGGLTFTQLDLGSTHSCGLTSAGAAYCWGRNNAGQLGDNSTTNLSDDHQSAPVAVAGGLTFTKISAGALHTCALTATGTPYCWGANGRGALGDGTTTNRPVPTAVGGGLSFGLITTGGYRFGLTCAVTTNGDAYCWGENDVGQLGIGTTEEVHGTPAAVAGGIAFASLDVAATHVCGVSTAGAGYCWGANVLGSLGDASTVQRSTPTAVTGGLAFARIVGGGFSNVNAHTCGFTTAGKAYCWGDNEVGALGDGSVVNHLEPSAVAGQSSFNNLAAGARHSCGVASTGILYCWGSNRAGQLGVNSVATQSMPVQVIGQK